PYQAVALIRFMAFDQHLCGHQPMSGLARRHVNVWTTECAIEGILDWLNGAEVILAFGIGQKPAVTLKLLIEFALIPAFGVDIRTIYVGLPDLDEPVTNRLARLGEQPARQM